MAELRGDGNQLEQAILDALATGETIPNPPEVVRWMGAYYGKSKSLEDSIDYELNEVQGDAYHPGVAAEPLFDGTTRMSDTAESVQYGLVVDTEASQYLMGAHQDLFTEPVNDAIYSDPRVGRKVEALKLRISELGKKDRRAWQLSMQAGGDDGEGTPRSRRISEMRHRIQERRQGLVDAKGVLDDRYLTDFRTTLRSRRAQSSGGDVPTFDSLEELMSTWNPRAPLAKRRMHGEVDYANVRYRGIAVAPGGDPEFGVALGRKRGLPVYQIPAAESGGRISRLYDPSADTLAAPGYAPLDTPFVEQLHDPMDDLMGSGAHFSAMDDGFGDSGPPPQIPGESFLVQHAVGKALGFDSPVLNSEPISTGKLGLSNARAMAGAFGTATRKQFRSGPVATLAGRVANFYKQWQGGMGVDAKSVLQMVDLFNNVKGEDFNQFSGEGESEDDPRAVEKALSGLSRVSTRASSFRNAIVAGGNRGTSGSLAAAISRLQDAFDAAGSKAFSSAGTVGDFAAFDEAAAPGMEAFEDLRGLLSNREGREAFQRDDNIGKRLDALREVAAEAQRLAASGGSGLSGKQIVRAAARLNTRLQKASEAAYEAGADSGDVTGIGFDAQRDIDALGPLGLNRQIGERDAKEVERAYRSAVKDDRRMFGHHDAVQGRLDAAATARALAADPAYAGVSKDLQDQANRIIASTLPELVKLTLERNKLEREDPIGNAAAIKAIDAQRAQIASEAPGAISALSGGGTGGIGGVGGFIGGMLHKGVSGIPFVGPALARALGGAAGLAPGGAGFLGGMVLGVPALALGAAGLAYSVGGAAREEEIEAYRTANALGSDERLLAGARDEDGYGAPRRFLYDLKYGVKDYMGFTRASGVVGATNRERERLAETGLGLARFGDLDVGETGATAQMFFANNRSVGGTQSAMEALSAAVQAGTTKGFTAKETLDAWQATVTSVTQASGGFLGGELQASLMRQLGAASATGNPLLARGDQIAAFNQGVQGMDQSFQAALHQTLGGKNPYKAGTPEHEEFAFFQKADPTGFLATQYATQNPNTAVAGAMLDFAQAGGNPMMQNAILQQLMPGQQRAILKAIAQGGGKLGESDLARILRGEGAPEGTTLTDLETPNRANRSGTEAFQQQWRAEEIKIQTSRVVFENTQILVDPVQGSVRFLANEGAAKSGGAEYSRKSGGTTSRGYASGGWTGSAPTDEVAGVVHGQEYVVDAWATAQFRPMLDDMRSGGAGVRRLMEGGGDTVRHELSGTLNVTVNGEYRPEIGAEIARQMGAALASKAQSATSMRRPGA